MSLPPIEELARLHQLREDALQAGVTVSSASNPSLDGTYPCHALDRHFLRQELNHLEATRTGKIKKWPRHIKPWERHLWERHAFFHNGTTTKIVHDTSRPPNPHEFGVAEFIALGAAIFAYHAALEVALHAAINGEWVAPSAIVTI